MDTKALTNICEKIRYQVEQEYSDLALLFVVFNGKDESSALNAAATKIKAHPAGLKAYECAEQSCQPDNKGQSRLACLAWASETRYVILKQRRYAALFFVNADDFENNDTALQGLYHLAWHSISLYEDTRVQTTSRASKGHENTPAALKDEHVITPDYTEIMTARENMLADVFAAIAMQLQGRKAIIRALAKRRCEMTLNATPGFSAELYPYPITLDAALLVFSDIMKSEPITELERPILKAREITEEIGFTYDDTSIQQWRGFALAAQELAWEGQSPNQILSLATYTSEDAYIRATAFLVAEILDVDPGIPAGLSSHNPFTETEVNERLHKKLAEQRFGAAMLISTENQYNPEVFLNAAREHNKNLLEGEPITGWCPLALKQAAQAMNNEPDPDKKKAAAENAFRSGLDSVPWADLEALGRHIFLLRRSGNPVNAAALKDCASALNSDSLSGALKATL